MVTSESILSYLIFRGGLIALIKWLKGQKPTKIFDMKIDHELSSTELQMRNYLESIFEGKEFLGAKIQDSLNIFKITEKMFENTIS